MHTAAVQQATLQLLLCWGCSAWHCWFSCRLWRHQVSPQGACPSSIQGPFMGLGSLSIKCGCGGCAQVVLKKKLLLG